MSLTLVYVAVYSSVACAIASLVYLFVSSKSKFGLDSLLSGFNADKESDDKISQEDEEVGLSVSESPLGGVGYRAAAAAAGKALDMEAASRVALDRDLEMQEKLVNLIARSREAVSKSKDVDDALHGSALIDRELLQLMEIKHATNLRSAFDISLRDINLHVYELELVSHILSGDYYKEEGRYVKVREIIDDLLKEMRNESDSDQHKSERGSAI